MAIDSQALFANLVEMERVHGHHSPEGQAIRTLSRALNGWSSGNLGDVDFVLLCGQAVEDWLKRRLSRSPWAAPSLAELLAAATAASFLSASEVERLDGLVQLCAHLRAGEIVPVEIDAIVESTIEIVAQHWS